MHFKIYIFYNSGMPILPSTTIISVPYSSEEILKAYLYASFLSLFTFFVADLSLVNSKSDLCLYYGFENGYPTAYFMLGTWLVIDGYIKVAVLVFVAFIYVISLELRCKTNLVAVCGNFLRLFWIFDFAWTVTCCRMFWSVPDNETLRLYQICSNPFQGYIFTLLLMSFVLIPIGIAVGSVRSANQHK